MHPIRPFPPWLMLVLLSFLAACGGNGSSVAPSTPSGGSPVTPSTPSERAQSEEYKNHPQLLLFDAVPVHDQGYLGKGASLVIVDKVVAYEEKLKNRAGVEFDNPFYKDFSIPIENSTERKLVLKVLDSEPELLEPQPPSPQGLSLVEYENAYVEAMHGTIVAQIAGGRDEPASVGEGNQADSVGVAPQADLYVYGIPAELGDPRNPFGEARYRGIDGSLGEFIKRFTSDENTDYDVVNMSFGFGDPISRYEQEVEGEDKLKSAYSNTIAALKQEGRTLYNRTVFVIAAGNAGSGADSPQLFAGLPSVDESLQEHVITVVATQPGAFGGLQVIASYSNRCGIAVDYCIAAPGNVNVYLPELDIEVSGRLAARGTSFAAPRVSGALAVLAGQARYQGEGETFRQVATSELVSRLLSTADKTGIYANENIYGQGMMNLNRASQLVGQQSVTAASSLNGPSYAFDLSEVAAGAASGDALQQAFAGHRLMTFDELDFPFPVPLSAVLDTGAARLAEERVLLRELDRLGKSAGRSASWQADGFAALMPNPGGAAAWFGAEDVSGELFPSGGADLAGHLGLLEAPAGVGYSRSLGGPGGPGLRAALFSELEDGERPGGVGVVAQLRPGSGSGLAAGPGAGRDLRLTLGLLHRDEYLLDTRGQGVFEPSGSATLFTGVGGRYDFGGRYWLKYGAALGWTRLRSLPGTALVGGTPLLTSEAELGVGMSDLLRPGDRFGLRLHQPLRVESGSVRVLYALRRTPEREVIQRELEASLEPSGRRVDLEGVYRLPLRHGLEAGILLRRVHQPGHVQGASGEWEALGALRLEL